MDEQKFRKRNTDCVYFLASPLTCKKGLECEYRHSEMARLNPTDCRYWLDRGCSNLACPFRHPPLEGRTGAEAESVDPAYSVTQPVTKKNVACYYFFNYFFCKNGDRCQFRHGDEVITHDWIPSKASSEANYVVAPEKKITTQSTSESTPLKKHPRIPQINQVGAAVTQNEPKTDFQQSGIKNVVFNEDVPAGKLDSLGPTEGFIQSRYQIVTDQSSEEHLEGLMEREELLELSPGFDVLVGEKSQNLDYEDDDADYLSGPGGEDSENDVELMGYDYDENGVKYDPDYPELGVRYEEYEEEIHDSYGGLNTISGDSRDRSFDHISSRKRKSMQMEPAFSERRDVDLRDLLKERRTTNGNGGSNLTRRNELSRLIVQRRESERPRWHVYNEFKSFHNGFNQRGKFRRGNINGHHLMEKRLATRQHFFSSEPSSRSAPRERRSTKRSSTFTGPKTLDQIKEEKKKKSQANGNNGSGVVGHSVSIRVASKSFKGPKPLDELLKKKRRLGSVVSHSEKNI